MEFPLELACGFGGNGATIPDRVQPGGIENVYRTHWIARMVGVLRESQAGNAAQVHPLLPGGGLRDGPMPALHLLRGRVHEICGPARRSLAAMIMGADRGLGPVIWIAAGWQGERLLPDGLRDFAEPGRMIFVTARHAPDLLWALEEALRSGAAPLVIADLPEPPALTPVRRLQLATEAGARTATQAPLAPIPTLAAHVRCSSRGLSQ